MSPEQYAAIRDTVDHAVRTKTSVPWQTAHAMFLAINELAFHIDNSELLNTRADNMARIIRDLQQEHAILVGQLRISRTLQMDQNSP